MIDMFKQSSNFILLFFAVIISSCTPPKSFYKMEGSINLRNKINKIIKNSEIDLNMSIQVISLKDNKVIYDYNSQKLLMPASTNKLYTSAAALYFLGKNHQFETDVFSDTKNLILKGGGDPDFSVKELDSLALEVSKKYKNIELGRFKGLGEMTPIQLKETTMDPDKRIMYRVELNADNADDAAEKVNILMGRKAELRFKFIKEQNYLSAKDLENM